MNNELILNAYSFSLKIAVRSTRGRSRWCRRRSGLALARAPDRSAGRTLLSGST